ncbi:uroporphyrinogen-III synthase [Pseudaminobacter arsenicus]|uniref:Uroporphyrinogen-III synthase n=1 Tax=Borborobacter arsenicus TaxID=1851146 RepID=A0A432V8J7_9HYPH|nr:uroporphyrinogen-III synthase [Pseudaminobacter arsenicus]RUM98393.1 uroporphyrinogen-III synthase [Pseudaminobacter arsenicus]
MNSRRVLVTRPQPGAAKTARRLAEIGFAPIVLPLSQTRALPVLPADVPATIDAVAVTSVNAIRHAPPDLIAGLAGYRCFAVGAKTAAAVREAGFSSVLEGPGDAAGLAGMIAGEARPGTLVAYLTGRVRLEAFESGLAKAGMRTFAIETYDTLAMDYSTTELAGELGNHRIDAVLLYSSKSAQAVTAIISRAEWDFHFAETRYFCLSARIAAKLQGAVPDKVSIAVEPTEGALLALLERAF